MMRVTDPTTFTERLLEAGLTQNELARRVRLSKSFMSFIANGTKRVDEFDAVAIANELGCPVTDLFQTAPRPSREEPVA